jgi:hypothetical protein
MKTRLLIIIAFVMIIPITESFAEPIEIKFGETVLYDNLNLNFYDIEDSRCPLDVTCVWEGKVSAKIHTSNETHKIGGIFEIDYPFRYMIPYTITLIDVKPHPISTEKPNYVAILDISKIEPEPYPVPDNLCPPEKVFDWDICVDECPFGQIERNGICHSFENIYDSNDKLPWYFLIVAYWPVSITVVGIIVTVIIVIWRKRK